jgi:ATP-binding cassette subfamily C (CFTR/MRP) protein 1
LLSFSEVLTDLFNVVGTLFVICYSAPLAIALVAPLLVIFFIIQRSYISVSRQLKRLVSVSRSPINSSLTETYIGAATIRAYKLEESYISENDQRIETSQKFSYPEIASNSWLLSRIVIMGNLVN